MWIPKIAVMLLCGALFAWGGYNFKPARRFIMPILITAFCLLLIHNIWLSLMLSSMATLSIGYGDNAVLSRVFGHVWSRSVYGLLTAICLSLPLFLTHHLLVVFFVLYLAQGFILENALKNWNQILGDVLIGIGFGSIVLIVHG